MHYMHASEEIATLSHQICRAETFLLFIIRGLVEDISAVTSFYNYNFRQRGDYVTWKRLSSIETFS